MYAKELVAYSVFACLALLAPGSSGGTEKDVETSWGSRAVSMIRLVAVCENFDGEEVLTTGYATFRFEDYSVCPSSELARVDPASCFWLEAGDQGISSEALRELEEKSDQFVYIEGTIGCKKHLFAGYIEQIELIMELETGEVLWTRDPTMKAARGNGHD